MIYNENIVFLDDILFIKMSVLHKQIKQRVQGLFKLNGLNLKQVKWDQVLIQGKMLLVRII